MKKSISSVYYVLCLSLILTTSCNNIQTKNRISISGDIQNYVKIIHDYSGQPDSSGVLTSMQFDLPEFRSGCYFVQDTMLGPWPNGANRVLPVSFGGEIRSDINREGGMFIYFELANGRYLVILPLASADITAWLNITREGALEVKFGTLGNEPYEGSFSLISWSVSDDFYKACRNVWENLLDNDEISIITDWRIKKEYPEVFNYLGWCSWEHFKTDITESSLIEAGSEIEASGIPVRWMLIDDGHQEVTNASHLNRKLISFNPNPEKFPNGWEKVMQMRDPEKIKWIGLWYDNQGYFNCIAPENKLDRLNQFLETLPSGVYLPKDDSTSIYNFFDAFMRSVKEYGFDFVKIDDQAANLKYYKGTRNAVRASAWYSRARENAVKKYFGPGVMNCMAHNQVCLFNTAYSSTTRSSIDYKYGNMLSAKQHILQSFNNSLWLGQTVWPDHDMFHSSDTTNGRLMAVSKALSGGPVYLSDPPADFVQKYIEPLCMESGMLLRPVAPGVPFPESALNDPINEERCYRVIAPLSFNSAAVVLYNLNKSDDKKLAGSLSPADFAFRNGLIQPYPGPEPLPEEGLVIYDWYNQTGREFKNIYETELINFSDKLLLLCPIKQNWAVVGRADKYLSTEALSKINYNKDSLELEFVESGPLVVFSKTGTPFANDYGTTELGNGFYLFNIPAGLQNLSLRIYRK